MLIEWVLILTLFAGGYREVAVSVETVGAFPSHSQCVAAGEAWKARASERNTRVLASTVCVQRTVRPQP